MKLTNIKARLASVVAALLIVSAQLFAPITAIIPTANAAPVCVTDTAGANDEPGQKDLTKLCVDYAGLPTSVQTTWNWDELGTTGANTLDACSLFDTDGDGNINYSVCVTTTGTPATLQTVTTYSCGDAKIDRCTSPATVVANGATSCSVGQQNTDPFPAGANYPQDTQGTCTVDLSTVGGSSAKLIDVCSYPSSQPNSDPSDCVIARPNSAKLEVRKALVPSNDSGRFDLKINGTIYATNVGDGGTTGTQVVTVDNQHPSQVVLEQANSTTNATSLSNYSTSVVCKDLHGTGSIVGSSNPTGASTRQLTVTVAADSDVVCVFTNTRQTGSITLVKNVINDNGGTATANDFGLSIGGTAVTSGQTLNLNTGSYAINEAGLAGYNFVSITGTGCPTQLGGNVTLANGQNITCTITNDDVAGQMRVIKNVVNDNGGSAVASDFTLSVNGQAQTQNQYFSVNAGTTNTVTESGPSGYTQTSLVCVNDASQQQVAHPVVMALAESVTCTVTNDDVAPTLTVIKHVVNDNGGTNVAGDFTMGVTGTNVSDASFQGAENPGTTVTLNAGSYSVGESGPSGYAATYSTNCSGSIAVGENKTCTVTNNDIAPILTVTKYVTNDNGGTLQASDFLLYVGQTNVLSGTANPFDAGSYLVSEVNQPGYLAGVWGGDCAADGSITLSLGGVYSCSITNNDIAPTLTIVKYVTNDNGGTKSASDFQGKIDGTNAAWGTPVTLSAGQHTASEVSLPGYTAGSWGGDCAADGTVTLALDQDAVCTITNNDQAGTLIVKKVVVNDNGGKATADDFSFTVNGGSAAAFEADGENDLTVNAGVYSVSETAAPGYTTSYDNCDNVVVANGQTATCTITNNDQPATLIVKKVVINDNGGKATADNFSFKVNGGTATAFEADGQNDLTVDAGTYNVVEPTAAGYGTTYDNCSDVVIDNGGTATCTITNNDVAPSLTIIKLASPSTDQSFDFTSHDLGNFSLKGDGSADSSKTFSDLSAGNYSVSEPAVDNWGVEYMYCDNDNYDFVGDTLTVGLGIGDQVTCYVSNVEKNTITGHKFSDSNANHAWDNGEITLKDWTITLTKGCDEREVDVLNLLTNGQDNTPCQGAVNLSTVTDANGAYSFSNLEPGTYTVCEVQKSGWTETFPQTSNGCHEIVVEGPGQTVVADFGNHKNPEVLSEELVNTGANAGLNIIVGLLLLGNLGAITFLGTRRQANAR